MIAFVDVIYLLVTVLGSFCNVWREMLYEILCTFIPGVHVSVYPGRKVQYGVDRSPCKCAAGITLHFCEYFRLRYQMNYEFLQQVCTCRAYSV